MSLGKRHGCLTALIITLAAIIAIVGSLYFFLPGLLRPYDLGIKTTEQSYSIALQKLGLTKDTAPEKGDPKDYKIKYGKAHKVNKFLTSEEITSFINFNRPDYYAIKNFQIRINPDNSIETCAMLNTSYVFSEILSGKYDSSDAKAAMPMLVLIPQNVNVYLKVDTSVKNNKMGDMTLEKVGIMGITIPNDFVNSSEAISFIKENLNTYMSKTNKLSGSYYELIQAKNENLQFKGKVPSSIKHIKVN